MKNIFILILFLFIPFTVFSQASSVKTAWLEKWDNSKKYLLKVAEAMPEEAYDFKPGEEYMSFTELLWHIKGNMDWLSTTYFSDQEYQRNASEMPSSKKALLKAIDTAFVNTYEKVAAAPEEEFTTVVDFFAGPKSKLQILNLLQDHVSHHRGQLTVYLNLNEVKRPQYIGW